jgi:hypothetical protein
MKVTMVDARSPQSGAQLEGIAGQPPEGQGALIVFGYAYGSLACGAGAGQPVGTGASGTAEAAADAGSARQQLVARAAVARDAGRQGRRCAVMKEAEQGTPSRQPSSCSGQASSGYS